jgi:uncharacterized protein YraI
VSTFSRKLLFTFLGLMLLLAFAGAAAMQGTGTDDDCGLPTRLVVGQSTFLNSTTPNRLRDQPSTSGAQIGQIFNDQNMLLLEGPVCAEGFTWWRVEYKGDTGWTVESSSDDYFMDGVPVTPVGPVTGTPAATGTPTSTPVSPATGDCGLPTRLFQGQFAFLNSTTPNRLRDQPSASGALIGQVFNDQNLILLEGPVCAEGFTWWRIDYKGDIGWTVESSSDDYFMDGVAATETPLPTSTPTITPTPSPTATPAFIGFMEPREAVWTSDGSQIVVSTENSGLFIFDADNLDAPPVQLLEEQFIESLAAHPTQPELVALIMTSPKSDASSYRVVLFDIANDEETELIDFSQEGFASGLQFAAERPRLMYIENGNLVGRDLDSDDEFLVFRPSLTESDFFNFVAISADGETYAATSALDDYRFSDVYTGPYGMNPIQIEIGGGIGDLAGLALNSDGSTVAVGTVNASLSAWTLPDLELSEFLRRIESTTSNTINAMIFDQQGRLITAESDPQAVIRVYSMPSMTLFNTYNPRGFTTARDVSLSPDGTQMAVVLDDVVHIVDVATMTRLAMLAPIRN